MRKMDKELEPERSPSRKKERKEFMCPKRYVLAVMLFLGFAVLNCVRSSLSVAIVAMVTDQQVTDSQGRKRTLVSYQYFIIFRPILSRIAIR